MLMRTSQPKFNNFKIDHLIYLDSEFISSKYEEVKGISPKTQFSKAKGMKGQANISLFSSGIHTQETRTFTISSFQMCLKIQSSLFKYPDLQLDSFLNCKGTLVGWLQGDLSLGKWANKSES